MHRKIRFPTATLVSAFLVAAGACSHETDPSPSNGGAPPVGNGGSSNVGQGGSKGGSAPSSGGPSTSGTAGTPVTPPAGAGGGGSGGPGKGGGSPGGAANPSGGAATTGGSGGGSAPVTKMSCPDRTLEPGKYTPGYTAAANPRVTQLVSTMTLPQKLAQMQGTTQGTEASKNYDDIQRSPDDTANGIRGYQYRDGPRGVNLNALQTPSRGGQGTYATAFPVSMARGASWDMDLEYRVGEAMGDETTASKNTMLLGPCMNILRHPAWGRAQETYGEDSYHIGRIATAWTAGVQLHVAGCAKHFAGNNIEDQRSNLNAEMDEQTLREIYGRHFEMVVKDGGVACIMAAYNLLNGTKSTQNQHLLTEVLRNDFGFRGFVLSDWWAMPPGQNFPDTATGQSNAAGAVKAGLDVELPWANNYGQLQSVVDSGGLTVAAYQHLRQPHSGAEVPFQRGRAQRPAGAEGAADHTQWRLDREQRSAHRPRPRNGGQVDGADQEHGEHAADQHRDHEEHRGARRGAALHGHQLDGPDRPGLRHQWHDQVRHGPTARRPRQQPSRFRSGEDDWPHRRPHASRHAARRHRDQRDLGRGRGQCRLHRGDGGSLSPGRRRRIPEPG